mgnify:CR=1 FL=1
MAHPPVEVHCTSLQDQQDSILVKTELYPHGFNDDQPYYINTRWTKSGNQVSFQSVDFGGKGDPGEPMLNGAAIRASAEAIEDQYSGNIIDSDSSFPEPDVGWQRVDDNGNTI